MELHYDTITAYGTFPGFWIVSEQAGRTMAVARGLAAGFGVGLLLGAGLALIYPLVVAGPLLGLALAWAGSRERPPDTQRVAFGGALLVGAGVVYLFGAVNTLLACQGTDVCGGPSTLPLLVYGLAVTLVGAAFAALAIARRPRTRSP